ncbi:MAG: metallophosphoesterase [Ndongobacter sp.]|nr:metallophosphoesterase [Ndongobacter sp.]
MQKRRRKIPKNWQPQTVRRRRILFSLALLLLLFVFFYRSNMRFVVTEATVQSRKIPAAFEGFRIVQISDLHSKLYGKDGEALRAEIEAQKPDIVVITGDLVDASTKDTAPVIRFLATFSREIPTYYVYGNHEMRRSLAEGEIRDRQMETALERAGVHILDNEIIPIQRLGSKIYLAGLCEDYRYYQGSAKELRLPVSHYLGRRPEDGYLILLAHNPFYWADYGEWGADLTLSGHVHGGGWRLPFVGGVFSPDAGLFPKYDKGLYTQKEQNLFVSAGLGNSGTPFRLFNPPELCVIRLESLSIH